MQAISGEELRNRLKRLGMTYARAAERLGLSLDGLNKQMRGDRPVSRQTEIILGYLEKEQASRGTVRVVKPQTAPKQEDVVGEIRPHRKRL
jgi:transcriptional regulator with XRE-family HTH domain